MEVKDIHLVVSGNDAEEESEEDEDYVPSEDWKKVKEGKVNYVVCMSRCTKIQVSCTYCNYCV